MRTINVILTVLFALLINFSFSQNLPDEKEPDFTKPTAQDTLETVVKIDKRHSPTKAALLSTVLPGAGQIYNKKYWKLPIVYGGLAGLGTWVGINAKNLRGYTKAYKLEVDGDPDTIGSYKGFTGETQLNTKRDAAKRNLDLSAILLGVFYALNVVDAAVDAHLYDYSITEDLSVSIKPDFSSYQVLSTTTPTFGVNISLNFTNKKAF